MNALPIIRKLCTGALLAGALAAAGPASAQFHVTTFAGSNGLSGLVNGTGGVARFNHPWGVAVDSSGTVFVADSGNALVRKITRAGAATTYAVGFSLPSGTAVDSSGTVYVVDLGLNVLKKIATNGTVSTLAGLANSPGFADGTGTTARFNAPYGVGVDASGTVYVADTGNHAIRKVTPAGAVTTLAGTGGPGFNDGPGGAAQFSQPLALAADASAALHVADRGNGLLRRVAPDGVVTTVASVACVGVAVNSSGGVFAADSVSRILSVSPAGLVSNVAGGDASGAADGYAPIARFNKPYGIALEPSSGALLVGDYENHSVRRLTPPVAIQVAGTNRFTGTNVPCFLVNGGIVAPAGTNSGALLVMPAAYEQLTNGALHIQLGGTNAAAFTNGHDQLNVFGGVQLSGALVATNFNGFTPRTGDVFSILSGAYVAGTFATSALPALPSGAVWAVAYGATGVVLQVGHQIASLLNPAGTNATGTLALHPFFVLATNAAVQIELGGTNAGASVNGHDRILTAGSAQPGGALYVSRLSNFVTQAGQGFVVLEAGAVTGHFASTNLPVLPAGQAWAVEQTTNRIALRIGVLNDGVLHPSGTNITGTLTAPNFFTQSAAGTLVMEIGGPVQGTPINGYDLLASPGPVQLAGTLVVSNIYGFDEQDGQSFTLLTGATVTGSFSSMSLPPLPAGLAWSWTNTGSAFTLSVTAAPPAAGYGGWAAAITNGLTNYHDSAAGDGYPNLLKYATGGSPTNADDVARLHAARTNGLLALVFHRNTNASDLTLIVEGSFAAAGDAAWTGVATNIAGLWGGAEVNEAGAGLTNPVSVTVSDPLSAGTNRFLRLRVTLP